MYSLLPRSLSIIYLKKLTNTRLRMITESIFAQSGKRSDGCSKQLERFWSEEGAHMLRRAVKDDNWEEVRQNFPTLEKDLLSKLPSNSFATWGNEFIRVLKRIFYPNRTPCGFFWAGRKWQSCVIERVNQDLTAGIPQNIFISSSPEVWK